MADNITGPNTDIDTIQVDDKPPVVVPPYTPSAPGKTPSVLPQQPPPDFMSDVDPLQQSLIGPAKKAQEQQSWADRQRDESTQKDRERMDRSWGNENARADDPALQHWNADQERAARTRGPMEQFGSVGMIFAMAASAFTRTPMTSALNAGAAAMTAIQQGDEKAYESAYKAWKDNSDLAIRRFDMEHRLYEDADKLLTTDINLWKQKTLEIATQFGHEKEIAMLNMGLDPEVLKSREAAAKAKLDLVKAKEGMEEFEDKRKMISEGIKALRKAHPDWKDDNKGPEQAAAEAQVYSNVISATRGMLGHRVTPDQEFIQRFSAEHPNATAQEFTAAFDEFKRGQKAPGGAVARPGTPSSDNAKRDADIQAANPDWSPTQVIDERNRQIKEAKEAKPTMDKDGVDLAANMLIKGNPAATTNVGRGVQGAANLTAIRNRASEILKEKGLNPEEAATLINENTAAFQGDKRGAASLALRSSQIIGASTVALNTMDRVLETSRKVSRTEFSDINKILLAGEQRTGSTEVINYGIALNTLVNNYARAIGAGSNALTDTARREAHELLQQYWSHGQISSALEQMKKELHDELRGAQEARKLWQEGASAIPGLGSGAVTGPPANVIRYDAQGNRIKETGSK